MSRRRKIDEQITLLSANDFDADFNDLTAWLVKQAGQYGRYRLRYLLAHMDDGVVWGRVEGETLITAADAFPHENIFPPLRTETLQQLRLFGEGGELLVWREPDGWRGRLLHDGDDDGPGPYRLPDELHLLWGATEGRKVRFSRGFVLLSEQDGLRHAPPLGLDALDLTQQRAHLCVRHYIDYDDDGQAYVAASRLAGLGVHSRWEGK